MKQITTLKTLVLICFLPLFGYTQVQDLSYTLSPMGEYILWGDLAGLKDGWALGGKLGFGFGQHVELNGTYLQALNLQTDFNDFGIPGFSEVLFTPRDVDLQRYGGELRLNLSRGTLLPFITIGSGIQRTELVVPQNGNILNEQIYLDLGAGVVLSIADRYTLSLSAHNNQYRFNAVRDLMTEDDRNTLDITADDYITEKISNWGLNASLQFYIGGRSPSQMTDIDKAYQRAFGSGLRGISVPVEPVAGKINFHENLPYRDTWYAGGNVGINLGSYIGLRGFYWRAMKDDNFQNFDDLSLYGGEAKFNLNSGQGITPFLTLGGGFLNVLDGYEPRRDMVADDQPFAMGGAGLTLPLSPYFKIFGGVRALLLTQEDLNDVAQPGDVLTSWNYHAGLRLIIGQKAKNPDVLLQTDINKKLNEQQQVYQQAKNELKEEYDQKLALLERQLDSIKNRNESLAQEVYQQPESLQSDTLHQEKFRSEENIEIKDTTSLSGREGTITLSPRELESLFRVITDYSLQLKQLELEDERLRSTERMMPGSQRRRAAWRKYRDSLSGPSSTDTLGTIYGWPVPEESTFDKSEEMKEMELQPRQRKEESEGQKSKNAKQGKETSSNYKPGISEDEHRKEIRKLEEVYQNQIRKLEEKLEQTNEISRKERERNDSLQQQLSSKISPEERIAPDTTADSTFLGRLYYSGLSGVAGITFGSQTAVTVGLRTNFNLQNSAFGFMTETYAGVGTESLMGLGINAIYRFSIKREGNFSGIIPYIGAGVGLQQNADHKGLKGTYGFIIGAQLAMWEGRAFVDYTMRNIFDYNQVVLGYKFSF